MTNSDSHTNREIREESLEKLRKDLATRERKQKRGPLGTVLASALVIVLVVAGIDFFASRDNGEKIEAEDSTTTVNSTSMTTTTESPDENQVTAPALALARSEALPETVTCSYPEDGKAAKEVSAPDTENIPATGTVNVTLKTNQGDIPMTLDRSVSPCTVNAITHLASNGYYNDTVCHRITTQGIYVLQCGDPTGNGAGGPGFSFANEYPTDEAEDTNSPVNYQRGTIAMANAGADTNGSQFFLNYKDSPLPPNYTYFGTISDEGLTTIDAIAAKGTKTGGSDGAPADEVRIESAEVE